MGDGTRGRTRAHGSHRRTSQPSKPRPTHHKTHNPEPNPEPVRQQRQRDDRSRGRLNSRRPGADRSPRPTQVCAVPPSTHRLNGRLRTPRSTQVLSILARSGYSISLVRSTFVSFLFFSPSENTKGQDLEARRDARAGASACTRAGSGLQSNCKLESATGLIFVCFSVLRTNYKLRR